MQTTVCDVVEVQGVGLHSGEAARLTIHPSKADDGIVFRRMDLPGTPSIPARWDLVEQTPLCTRIRTTDGASVSTIEHIMAALAGCGVHNARIDLDGPEVPILDGSAVPFVRAILEVGRKDLERALKVVEVLRPVDVSNGHGHARLEPAENLWIDFTIDFEDRAIGRQSKSLNLANGSFVHELSDSRTFCRQSDVDQMRASGLALGGTYENAVVVDGDAVLTPGGFRHPDEAVRHKMLDALGDLYLAGGPLLGRYTGERAGHALTNSLLRALFSDPRNYRVTTVDGRRAVNLPGVGVDLADAPQAV
ncbi:MAG: UDP-3-O-acyl-N-acetylglucosamine deacetylase [Pseudomonadota bacterium]